MRAVLLFLGVAAIKPALKGTALKVDPQAEKQQEMLDYEAGENEAARDPEAQAAETETKRTAKLEQKLKAQRSWEPPEEAEEDKMIHTVIEKERKSTAMKTQKRQQDEEQASDSSKKVDEAKLDAEFGEDEKSQDVEEQEMKKDQKRDASLADKVHSQHKWVGAA